MRKTLLTALAFVATAPLVLAQITLDNSNTVTTGTTLYRSEDTNPSITEGSAGASQTWDFSGLNAYVGTFREVNITAPGMVPVHGDSFPNAAFAIDPGDGSYLFVDTSSTALMGVGIGGPFEVTDGVVLEVTLPFVDPQVLLQFPSTFATAYLDTLYLDLFRDTLPEAQGFVDSARVKRLQYVESEMDAYGTITTPLGTFDCLRERRVENSIDSVWAEAPLLGIGFNDTVITQTNTEIVYNFYTESYNLPIVEIRTDQGGSITSVNFVLDSADCCVDVSIEEHPLANRFSVYPNPASEFINVITTYTEGSAISLYDMTGKMILTEQINSAQNRLNVEGLAEGLYIYRIEDLNGEIIKTDKIQVQ